jgi:hypothetical protein
MADDRIRREEEEDRKTSLERGNREEVEDGAKKLSK